MTKMKKTIDFTIFMCYNEITKNTKELNHMIKNEQIKTLLKNNTQTYKQNAYVYLLHITGTNFYKFGETKNAFPKRKANIIQEWKAQGVEIEIEPLLIHSVKSKVQAILIESTIRKKLSKIGFEMYGNDYFESEKTPDEILNIVQKML